MIRAKINIEAMGVASTSIRKAEKQDVLIELDRDTNDKTVLNNAINGAMRDTPGVTERRLRISIEIKYLDNVATATDKYTLVCNRKSSRRQLQRGQSICSECQ